MDALNTLRLSLVSWLRTPVVFVLAILMLAVGIGASVAAYGFLNAALLQPLPVKNPQELTRIWSSLFGSGNMTAGDYYELAETSDAFSHSILTRLHRRVGFQLDNDSHLTTAAEVSGNYFRELGVSASRGRTILPEDDVAGADSVVVVSERFWREQLEARDDAIGAPVLFNGRPATVAGVISGPFQGTFRMTEVDVWFPHHQLFEDWQIRTRNFHVSTILFRLADDRNAGTLQAELDVFADRMKQDHPGTRHGYSLILRPEREAVFTHFSDLAQQSFFILGVLSILLLIACANVSNILLAKIDSRRSELAVRRAYGARPVAILGLAITDAMVVAISAGALGSLLVLIFIRGFSLLGFDVEESQILNLRLLLFVIGITLLTGLLCGTIPAINALRTNINEALKETSRTATRFRTGKTLIVAQVALSLALLIAGGLFLRSIQEARKIDPGIRTENLLSFSLNLENLGGYDLEERASFYGRLIERLENEPEVASVGVGTHRLLQGAGGTRTYAGDIDFAEGSDLWRVNFLFQGPGFLETIGVPLVLGRVPTLEEIHTRERLVVVNEAMSERFWPGENPIGREFIPWGGPERTNESRRVVGVFRDFRILAGEPPAPMFIANGLENRSVVVVNTRISPQALAPRIERIVRDIEPGLSIYDLHTIDDILAQSIQPLTSGFTIMLTVGLIGLAISMVGIYAALNYWVRRSHHEIGLRVALGASNNAIVGLFMRRGAVTVVAGLVLGLGIAALAMPHASELFFEVSPWDPVTLVVVPSVLLCASLLASYLSARHAARVDPMVALRSE